MMERFKDKYRIDSQRMPGWDYALGGKYYVTICTGNKICCFGDVKNDRMELSEMGEIVDKFWQEIPACFSETYLDEYVVMPNHVHGIIVMKRSEQNTDDESSEHTDEERRDETLSRLINEHIGNFERRRDLKKHIGDFGKDRDNFGKDRDETGSRLYMPENMPGIISGNMPKNEKMAAISPKPGSLSVIIGGWKSKCTKEFKKIGHSGWFSWQPRFYDEIIRNDTRLSKIRWYIRNNPKNWEKDEYNLKI
ncbi:MAG: hypothetical protein ABII90_15290 [Bacteroidota bacterium]